jgi:hypothetical protein
MKKILTGIMLVVLVVTKITAQSDQTDELLKNKLNTITTAVPFLIIAPDARAGGMGDMGVASSPDANSMHWNPAKYGFIKKDFGISVSYSPWLRKLVNDINLAYLTGYKKINDRQVIAMSLRYFSLGNITFTDNVGTVTGNYKPNEFSIDAAYAFRFTNTISGAIALRYIYSNLTGGIYVGGAASKAGQSGAADVSLYYEKPIVMKKMTSSIAVGLNISNIGAKISYTENLDRDFIPTNLRLGAAYNLDIDKVNSLSFMADFNKLLIPTRPVYYTDSFDNAGNKVIYKGKNPDVSIVRGMIQSFYDAPGGFSEEINEIGFSVGMEYWYAKQFAVRAGYFNESKTKGNRKYLTFGAGLRYSIFGLDFSYLLPVTQHNPLENTLRFSLLFDFDKVKSKKEKNAI